LTFLLQAHGVTFGLRGSANGAYETKLNNAVVDALDWHTAMTDQALRNPKVFKGLAELLVDEVYRQLRDKADTQHTS
jgi:type I restriction enzyme, R subunit